MVTKAMILLVDMDSSLRRNDQGKATMAQHQYLRIITRARKCVV